MSCTFSVQKLLPAACGASQGAADDSVLITESSFVPSTFPLPIMSPLPPDNTKVSVLRAVRWRLVMLHIVNTNGREQLDKYLLH